jgi:hypothetical protein
MKKFLIAAGAALVLAISGSGSSHAGERIIYYSPAPVVVYSHRAPVVVPGRPHGHVVWKDHDRFGRNYRKYHHGYVGRDIHRHYRGYPSPYLSGSYYQPGFSLSIGLW